MKYTGIVHTYNEEENIEDCLKSLVWCDEIILIDMKSKDKTVEIARKYTDKIFTFNYEGYADPARKFGLEKASGDWIMVLDADERLPSELIPILKEIAEKGESEIVYLPWKNIIFGKWIKHTQWWPDYHPRFFKKGYLEYSSEIHNFEVVKGNKKYLPKKEKFAVIHYNYKDIQHFKAKTERYTNVEALRLKEKNIKSGYCKMFYHAFKEFSWRYILGLGVLDGWTGLVLSYLMGRYKFITYYKLWKMK